MAISNGKIVAPITFADVAQMIGVTTDFGRNPDADINMWSARKFVRSNSKKRLSDDDMARLNYGFNISGNSDTAVYEADPDKALSKAIASGGKWTYLRPRGVAYGERTRLKDMEGYNSKAEPPYVVTLEKTTTNEPTIWADIEESANCEIPVQNLKGTVFADDLSSYHVAVLWRKVGQTNGVQIQVSDETIGASLALGNRLVFHPTFSEAGQYDLAFALTNADMDSPYEDDKVWLYLPETYRQVSYNPMSGTVEITLYMDAGNGFVVSYIDDIVNEVTLRFYIRKIEMTYSPEAYVYVELLDAYGDVLASAEKYTGEIDSDAYYWWGHMSVKNPQTDALYADELYIRVYYKFREFDSDKAFTTMYLDLIRNMATREEVAPVTIKSVLNSL
jgi:hypothetical protein